MENPADIELEDEAAQFLQKALYVEPLEYAVDLDMDPSNGHEYIHQVRLEHKQHYPDDTKIPFCCFADGNYSDEQSNNISAIQFQRNEAKKFSDYALDLRKNKEELMLQNPAKSMEHLVNERDWCIFCLGSELYKKLYNDQNVSSLEANIPEMNIVLYLPQAEIMRLVCLMKSWYRVVGMSTILYKWFYALFACLEKPVPLNFERLLENFYDKLKRNVGDLHSLNVSEVTEKQELIVLSGILHTYFCVKSYTVGPSLSQFKKLV